MAVPPSNSWKSLPRSESDDLEAKDALEQIKILQIKAASKLTVYTSLEDGAKKNNDEIMRAGKKKSRYKFFFWNIPVRVGGSAVTTVFVTTSSTVSSLSSLGRTLLTAVNPIIVCAVGLAIDLIDALYQWYNHRQVRQFFIQIAQSIARNGSGMVGASVGAIVGTIISPGLGTIIGGIIGGVVTPGVITLFLRWAAKKKDEDWLSDPHFKLAQEVPAFKSALKKLGLPEKNLTPTRDQIEMQRSIKICNCHPDQYQDNNFSDEQKQEALEEFINILQSYEMTKRYLMQRNQWQSVCSFATYGSKGEIKVNIEPAQDTKDEGQDTKDEGSSTSERKGDAQNPFEESTRSTVSTSSQSNNNPFEGSDIDVSTSTRAEDQRLNESGEVTKPKPRPPSPFVQQGGVLGISVPTDTPESWRMT